MRPTFRSFQYFNYRLWFSGALVANIGTWMQRVAQDWLVLTILTDDSGSRSASPRRCSSRLRCSLPPGPACSQTGSTGASC